MPQPAKNEHLTASLRAIASRAAATTRGCAFLFGQVPGDDGPDAASRLRAAAGFPSADAARAGAKAVSAEARGALDERETRTFSSAAGLGAVGAGDGLAIPLALDGNLRGVLVVAAPDTLDETSLRTVEQLANSAAVHLDHALLQREVAELRGTARHSQMLAEEKGDELLKLSEELFAQDIQLLRSNEKLGKIEKLKNDFIEKMSLELRTPLNSIIEATISVLAGENDNLSDTAKASLRNALDEGTAFQRTLQNILDLWRIKQGELPLELQEVNFAEVVEEAIFSVQETLNAKNIAVTKEIQEPLPRVVTDLAKANQIIFLLLDNAAKFTERGGITISARVQGEHLCCSIADTGIGICPDDRQLIFDEFFQVDDFSSHKYRGAGLGLTLVRDLVVLLDGELTLESEPGRGTTVTFRIPIQTA